MKATGKKKRNCVKGKSCGASCISKTKQCRVDAKNQLSNELKSVAQTIQTNPKQDQIKELKQQIESLKIEIEKLKNDPSFVFGQGTYSALKGIDGVVKKYEAQYQAMPNWNDWFAKSLKKRLYSQKYNRDRLESRLKTESLAAHNARMEEKKLEDAERRLRWLEKQ